MQSIEVMFQFLNGLALASSLFLVASGLSIIFGVTRIVNFAHGSFYMLGAYLAYTLVDWFSPGFAGFWGGVLLAALGVGLIGTVMELVLLRRIYKAPELFQLLATFGVVLIVADSVLMIWGPVDLVGPRAPGLRGAVSLLGQPYPQYDLFLIVLGPAVLGLLWLLFHRTRWGTLVRAATQDREMAGALGVNQALLFTSVFFVGAFLAGLGGAIQLPREAINHRMDLQIIVEAFVVVVVGGMGSLPGAFLAAVLIGELHAFGILLFPEITLVLVFLVMAVVLVLRPWGLLGRPEAEMRGATAGEPLRQWRGRGPRLALWAVLGVLLVFPLVAGDYLIYVATEIFIFALFAVSLHFILGGGGMVSFGHAAYFGLGAYGAALAVKYAALSMGPSVLAAVLLGGLGAWVYGWFCVRLTGIYLAMLTLAFAQITFAIAFQWYGVTGGDNGLLGIWPAPWASHPVIFYYFALVLCGAGVMVLRHVLSAPFGYTLRAVRDSPLRCDAIGIDTHRQQWLAFALAGVFAGLAGGVFAFFKGSVFPDSLSIPITLDALVMVLMGGMHTLSGPLVGAVVYKSLQIFISSYTEYWQFILGFIIVGLVLVFPQGVLGYLHGRWYKAEEDIP